MIFSALGTCLPFPRLLRKIDELAGVMKEEFLVQTGQTQLPVHHCRTFDYAPSLLEYFKQARLVIVHAGLGVQIELMRMQKPFIVVPRQKRFHEHFDDHQLETCEILAKKYGIKYILNVDELTVDLLNNYNYIVPFVGKKLDEFHENIKKVFGQQERRFYEISFY